MDLVYADLCDTEKRSEREPFARAKKFREVRLAWNLFWSNLSLFFNISKMFVKAASKVSSCFSYVIFFCTVLVEMHINRSLMLLDRLDPENLFSWAYIWRFPIGCQILACLGL